jgi:hypothetical protein
LPPAVEARTIAWRYELRARRRVRHWFDETAALTPLLHEDAAPQRIYPSTLTISLDRLADHVGVLTTRDPSSCHAPRGDALRRWSGEEFIERLDLPRVVAAG